MNVCLIVDDYLPESGKIAAKMMHELACEFMRQGHDVLVITPDSYKKYGNRSDHFYFYDGVNVFRFPSGRLKNIAKPLRLINEFLLPLRAWYFGKKYFKQKKFDYIIYYSPSIFWSFLVRKLRKISDSKTFLILRDFFPQWVFDNGMIKESSLLGQFFRFFERKNYLEADRIGIQSPANIDYFKVVSPNFGQKTCLLYNWSSSVNNSPKLNKYRREFKLEDKIIFFYGGNIGKAQDISILLYLAKKMSIFEDVHFLFIGEGDEVQLIKDAISNDNYGNVSYYPAISQEEFYSLLHEIDVGLFSLDKDHKSHNFPGKILGYLSSAKPVLGAVNSGNDLIPVINESNCGYVSESDESELLFENAKKLLDKNLRERMGENCKKLTESLFSVESALNTILGTKN